MNVVFPAPLYASVVEHGRRKLAGAWEPDEEQAPKAYGLVGARVEGSTATVIDVVPLRNNLRARDEYKDEVDRLMDELAVPSETPFDRRGWVADPREVLAAERRFEAGGAVLLGAYHMHRVAWPDDPRRDTCTALDTALARGSGLWAFILSMVDPVQPVLRAFFEGDNHREARISVMEDARR
ncbi:MAG TPA: hypothetical protein VHF27_00120 [Acidimicrobiales bacterium]|nr:hypothetical protein [Acidimicrobiales bacterium]